MLEARQHPTRTRRAITIAAALTIVALLVAAYQMRDKARPTAASTPQPTAAASASRFVDDSEVADEERCGTPAPRTAAGFDALFRALPVNQWGAADVGITVPLEDGRSVWLWGDTLSLGRFVHSSAITQDGGCLHVSHGGEQLLPNDGERFYWIEKAHATGPDALVITAEEIVKDPAGEWGWTYTGHNRTAAATVDAAGDVTFQKWTGRFKAEQAATVDDLVIRDNGQIQYSHRAHAEFTLASGRTLVTAGRNWTDGKVHPLDTYRPVFAETATATLARADLEGIADQD